VGASHLIVLAMIVLGFVAAVLAAAARKRAKKVLDPNGTVNWTQWWFKTIVLEIVAGFGLAVLLIADWWVFDDESSLIARQIFAVVCYALAIASVVFAFVKKAILTFAFAAAMFVVVGYNALGHWLTL
jgi:hypothetical protein